MTAIGIDADRLTAAGARDMAAACLDDPSLTFIMTKQFICSPAQVAGGQAYWFYPQRDLPSGSPVILRLSHVAVAAPRS